MELMEAAFGNWQSIPEALLSPSGIPEDGECLVAREAGDGVS